MSSTVTIEDIYKLFQKSQEKLELSVAEADRRSAEADRREALAAISLAKLERTVDHQQSR
jgi:hypothetical protein